MAQKKQCIQVLMIGARRIGKSSVLASMISSFDSLSDYFPAGASIRLAPDSSTEMLLKNKFVDLQDVFNKCLAIDDDFDIETYSRSGENGASEKQFSIDEQQTDDYREYRFHVFYKTDDGQEKTLDDILFIDIPGENITKAEHQKTIQNYIARANVLVIPVDTVHLMEENGAFFSAMHQPDQIASLINETCFTSMGHRFTLFVPLKCEKYYHEGRMDEVNRAVKDKFKELINILAPEEDFFGTGIKERITVAITPILTMGGIVFSDFKRDSNKNVVVRERKNSENASPTSMQLLARPKTVYYKIYKKTPRFNPKYCEQPILFTLAYFFECAQKNLLNAVSSVNDKKNNSVSIFQTIKTIVQSMQDLVLSALNGLNKDAAEAYRNQTVKLTYKGLVLPNLKKYGDGYEFINDPFELAKK